MAVCVPPQNRLSNLCKAHLSLNIPPYFFNRSVSLICEYKIVIFWMKPSGTGCFPNLKPFTARVKRRGCFLHRAGST